MIVLSLTNTGTSIGKRRQETFQKAGLRQFQKRSMAYVVFDAACLSRATIEARISC
jgi:hypothetical protein